MNVSNSDANLVEIESSQWEFLRGHNDDGVPSDHSWGEERHKRQQRRLIWAENGQGSHGFVHLDGGTVEGRLLNRAAVLVRVSRPME